MESPDTCGRLWNLLSSFLFSDFPHHMNRLDFAAGSSSFQRAGVRLGTVEIRPVMEIPGLPTV
jgi:hypothetical protein